jgi:hypothetical protein
LRACQGVSSVSSKRTVPLPLPRGFAVGLGMLHCSTVLRASVASNETVQRVQRQQRRRMRLSEHVYAVAAVAEVQLRSSASPS